MNKRLSLFLLLIPVLSFAQISDDSLLIGDHYRSFHYVPPASGARPRSLLFLMHGSGGVGINMARPATALQATAEKERLLIVYPDAYLHFWNECRRYSNAVANKEDIDENAFFEAMIGYFQQRYGIDSHRVYAAGFSGGGHMAYKLGLTMPGKIRAIAAIVANLPDSASLDCGEARQPLPVMIVNGTEDQTNPYNGGEMFLNNSSFGVVRSSEQSFHYWAQLAGYTGEPVYRLLPDVDSTDHKRIESFTYKKAKKPEVVLLKVIGGHHEFPTDINTFVEVWKFFKRQG